MICVEYLSCRFDFVIKWSVKAALFRDKNQAVWTFPPAHGSRIKGIISTNKYITLVYMAEILDHTKTVSRFTSFLTVCMCVTNWSKRSGVCVCVFCP